MKMIPLAKRAIALPLLGWVGTWILVMTAVWVGMAIQEGYDGGIARPTVYIYLVAFALAGFSALTAHGWAVKAVAADETDGLARASLRFATLMVVLGLAVTTVFALTNFLGAFNSFSSQGQNSNVGLRFVWTYLPILIATGVVVFIVLRAFVFRTAAQVAEGEAKPKMSERQKALALGYAVPILCTAFAIILGLFIYDATHTNLDVWIWVLIISIVGFGVIAGTRFAARARQARVEAPRPKTALAAGAATVNFVLSIIFGATVSIMAFTTGQQAVVALQEWVVWKEGDTQSNYSLAAPTLDWFARQMAPAAILLILAVVGVYLSITERHRKLNEIA
jgi:heme/copper-type cytochrome/quinol oxidase subunit 2